MKRLWRVNTHTFALAEFFRSAAQMSRRRLDCCLTLKFKVNISFLMRKRLRFTYLIYILWYYLAIQRVIRLVPLVAMSIMLPVRHSEEVAIINKSRQPQFWFLRVVGAPPTR